jgi:hypothetical protein
MTHHVLKAHPPMFWALKDGTKNFEVRKDDRAYQTGDTVEIKYYEPLVAPAPPSQFMPAPWESDIDRTPKSVQRRNDESMHRTPYYGTITFVLRGGQYGVEDGYVVLALKELHD